MWHQRKNAMLSHTNGLRIPSMMSQLTNGSKPARNSQFRDCVVGAPSFSVPSLDFHAFNMRAEAAELLVNEFVPAIDVVNPVDLGLALCF